MQWVMWQIQPSHLYHCLAIVAYCATSSLLYYICIVIIVSNFWLPSCIHSYSCLQFCREITCVLWNSFEDDRYRLGRKVLADSIHTSEVHYIVFDWQFRWPDEVYLAHDILMGDKVIVKLGPLEGKGHSLDHEFEVYRELSHGIGIPHIHWFGTEAGCDAMVIEHLGLSLDELFAQCHFHFSLKTVLLLACQLVSKVCLCSYTWLTSVSSSVTCSISTLTTSFTVILSRATSSWVSTRMWTWSTLSILGYWSNSEILIHTHTFLIAKVVASLEQLALHPSIVTLDWSLEDEMIWSCSPTSLFISFVALYHGRGREETSFWWNNNSPCKTCITDFHWSFVPFWNSADHFPLIASLTTTAITIFLIVFYLLRIRSGQVRVAEGVRKKERKQIWHVRRALEQNRSGKDLASTCVLRPRAHSVLFRKDNQTEKETGGTEVNIQTGDTGGNIWVYILTMCFIWNKSGEIENGEHKVEYRRGIWTGMGMDKTCGVVQSRTEEEPVTDCSGIMFKSIIKCISSSEGVPTSHGVDEKKVSPGFRWNWCSSGYSSCLLGV